MSDNSKPSVKWKVSKRLGRKREKYLPDSLPLLLPPCKICGKKASGIHYGLNTCEACKGFFRRYLKRKEPYVCEKGGNCDLNIKAKGPHCSACRMKKCLRLGMSKEGVRQGRYTLTERTKRILEFKCQQQSSSYDWSSSEWGNYHSDRNCNNKQPGSLEIHRNSGYNPDDFVKKEKNSDDDLEKFVKTKGSSCYTSDDSVTALYDSGKNSGDLSPFSPSNMNLLSKHYPDSFDNSCSKHSLLHELSSLTSHEVDCPNECSSAELSPLENSKLADPDKKRELSTDVQEVLSALTKAYKHLQHITQGMSDDEIRKRLEIGYAGHQDKVNLFGKLDPIPTKDYNEIYQKTNLDVDSRTENSSQRREEFGMAMADYVAFSNEIPGFNELSAKDKATLVKASRLDFFLTLEYRAKDPETEMMISYSGRAVHISDACAYLPQDMLRSWWRMTYDLRKLQLTTEEHALLLALCLMSTDRCKLDCPESVEKIEAVLVKACMSLLQRRYKERAGLQFSAFVSLLTKLRGISEEYHATYRKICEDTVLITRAPELLSMLFDE
ncbi:nuclear receptor subfamily 1 group D member 2-like [Crassostrea virginica]